MRILKFLCCILLTLSIFSSCSSDDSGTDDDPLEMSEDMGDDDAMDDMDTDSNGASLTATVNGNAFNATIQEFIGASIAEQSGFYAIALFGLEIVSSNNAKGIALAMAGFDFDTVIAGKEWTMVQSDNGLEIAGGGYTEGDIANGENDDIDTEETTEVFIRITSIDKENRIISGEFSFISSDEDTGTIYNVTDGVFTNIPYDMN